MCKSFSRRDPRSSSVGPDGRGLRGSPSSPRNPESFLGLCGRHEQERAHGEPGDEHTASPVPSRRPSRRRRGLGALHLHVHMVPDPSEEPPHSPASIPGHTESPPIPMRGRHPFPQGRVTEHPFVTFCRNHCRESGQYRARLSGGTGPGSRMAPGKEPQEPDCHFWSHRGTGYRPQEHAGKGQLLGSLSGMLGALRSDEGPVQGFPRAMAQAVGVSGRE